MEKLTCSKCKQEKLPTEFNKSSNNKSGYRSYCRRCHAIENLKWTAKIPWKERKAYYDEMYPGVPRSSVYGLYNEHNELMYIGESHNTPYRIYCHLKGGKMSRFAQNGIDVSKWISAVLWEGPNSLRRKMMESDLIFKLQPLHNIMYKNRK